MNRIIFTSDHAPRLVIITELCLLRRWTVLFLGNNSLAAFFAVYIKLVAIICNMMILPYFTTSRAFCVPLFYIFAFLIV